jgi:hypothetical protein
MIIKIDDRTPAQLARLEAFFHSQNWVSYPGDPQFQGHWDEPTNIESKREVEHPFARLLRKTTSKRGSSRFNITLQVSPYIMDIGGGTEIKVPARFLIELMQALDLFSDKYELIDLELL